MIPLKFKYKRIGLLYSKPVNEKKKLANELKVTASLAHCIEQIHKANAYVLVSVSRDGETFKNQLIGYNEPECELAAN